MDSSKRPDSMTDFLVERKPLAWDLTVVDAFAVSHIHNTSSRAGEAANKAAANKVTKYSNLTATHIFAFIAMKTAGSFNNLAIEIIEQIRKKLKLSPKNH